MEPRPEANGVSGTTARPNEPPTAGLVPARDPGRALALANDRTIVDLMVHHSRSPRVFREWATCYQRGLLPYEGTWQTPKDIARRRRLKARRSWIIVLELVLAFAGLTLVNGLLVSMLLGAF
jgi:hypothetical protein